MEESVQIIFEIIKAELCLWSTVKTRIKEQVGKEHPA
jgi:hypothetical protein